MKKFTIIICILFANYVFCSTYEVSKKIDKFSLFNQFDKKITIDEDTKYMLVSFEKNSSETINSFIEKNKGFLTKNNTVFIVNISKMPSIILKMFAIPKMRNFKHNILLVYDENNNNFKEKQNCITLYKLDKLVVKKIDFLESKEDLQRVFNENK